MTVFITQVLQHTPVWVWAILAGLIGLGLLQSRDHVLSRSRLLAQPLALGLMSVVGAASTFGLHAAPVAGWLAGALLGAALNQPLRLPRQVQALSDGRWAVGGSWAPMALLMGIFWLRYAISASLAMAPGLAGQPGFAAVASALYGAATGLFAARAWRVLQHGAPAALRQAAAW